MDNPTQRDFDEWLQAILERVFTATPESDSHEDWRALNE
jgi:hypothetical protein